MIGINISQTVQPGSPYEDRLFVRARVDRSLFSWLPTILKLMAIRVFPDTYSFGTPQLEFDKCIGLFSPVQNLTGENANTASWERFG